MAVQLPASRLLVRRRKSPHSAHLANYFRTPNNPKWRQPLCSDTSCRSDWRRCRRCRCCCVANRGLYLACSFPDLLTSCSRSRCDCFLLPPPLLLSLLLLIKLVQPTHLDYYNHQLYTIFLFSKNLSSIFSFLLLDIAPSKQTILLRTYPA